MMFIDRRDAGRQLAQKLSAYANRNDVVVLALPRGGVPVAYEVAKALHAPLDVLIVRKVGVPTHEELAMGAIASGGVTIKNNDVIRHLQISDELFYRRARIEQQELHRREVLYRDGSQPLALRGRICIVVDDGIATGASMLAALSAVRTRGAKQLIVAVPVAARMVASTFRANCDDFVSVLLPQDFGAVGSWYEDFSQTSDEEVRKLLSDSRHEMAL